MYTLIPEVWQTIAVFAVIINVPVLSIIIGAILMRQLRWIVPAWGSDD